MPVVHATEGSEEKYLAESRTGIPGADRDNRAIQLRRAGVVRYYFTWQALRLAGRRSVAESGKHQMRLCCLTRTRRNSQAGTRELSALVPGVRRTLSP